MMLEGVIQVVALCAVFHDPSFYLSQYRQDRICEWIPHVLEESEKKNLDPFLVMGLVTVESNWNRTAVSHAGACGLTQVMPKYTGGPATRGVRYTCEDLKVPKTSITAGTDILSWWVQEYAAGDTKVGLCGYYSGFTCKPKIHRAGTNYYKKVLKNRDKIKSIYESKLIFD